MLKKVTASQISTMLCLLAMVTIAVGMPLAHPFFHDHSAHDYEVLHHNSDHFESSEGKTGTHSCPICSFLSTNSIEQSVSLQSVKTDGPLINTIQIIQFITVKIYSSPSEPRAPPPHLCHKFVA
jgi:hypothetical protein